MASMRSIRSFGHTALVREMRRRAMHLVGLKLQGLGIGLRARCRGTMIRTKRPNPAKSGRSSLAHSSIVRSVCALTFCVTRIGQLQAHKRPPPNAFENDQSFRRTSTG